MKRCCIPTAFIFVSLVFLGLGVFLTLMYVNSPLLQQVKCTSTNKYYSHSGDQYLTDGRIQKISSPSYNVLNLVICEKFTTSEGNQYDKGMYQFTTSDLIYFTGAPKINSTNSFSVEVSYLYIQTQNIGDIIIVSDGGGRHYRDWCLPVMAIFYLIGVMVIAMAIVSQCDDVIL